MSYKIPYDWKFNANLSNYAIAGLTTSSTSGNTIIPISTAPTGTDGVVGGEIQFDDTNDIMYRYDGSKWATYYATTAAPIIKNGQSFDTTDTFELAYASGSSITYNSSGLNVSATDYSFHSGEMLSYSTISNSVTTSFQVLPGMMNFSGGGTTSFVFGTPGIIMQKDSLILSILDNAVNIGNSTGKIYLNDSFNVSTTDFSFTVQDNMVNYTNSHLSLHQDTTVCSVTANNTVTASDGTTSVDTNNSYSLQAISSSNTPTVNLYGRKLDSTGAAIMTNGTYGIVSDTTNKNIGLYYGAGNVTLNESLFSSNVAVSLADGRFTVDITGNCYAASAFKSMIFQLPTTNTSFGPSFNSQGVIFSGNENGDTSQSYLYYNDGTGTQTVALRSYTDGKTFVHSDGANAIKFTWTGTNLDLTVDTTDVGLIATQDYVQNTIANKISSNAGTNEQIISNMYWSNEQSTAEIKYGSADSAYLALRSDLSAYVSNINAVINQTLTVKGSSSLDNGKIITDGNGGINLTKIITLGGESDISASTTFNDPDEGIPRDAKFGYYGIAVTGGTKTDTLSVTGDATFNGNALIENGKSIYFYNTNNDSVYMFYSSSNYLTFGGTEAGFAVPSNFTVGGTTSLDNGKITTNGSGNLTIMNGGSITIWPTETGIVGPILKSTSAGTIAIEDSSGGVGHLSCGNIIASGVVTGTNITATSTLTIPSSTYSALPTSPTAGMMFLVKNGCKPGEASGSGTGVLCVYDGSNWMNVSSGTTVTI